jgi:hypothetical protein
MQKHHETTSPETIKRAIEMYEQDRSQAQQKQSVMAALGEMQVPPEYLDRAVAEVEQRKGRRKQRLMVAGVAAICLVCLGIGYGLNGTARSSPKVAAVPASAPAAQAPVAPATAVSPAMAVASLPAPARPKPASVKASETPAPVSTVASEPAQRAAEPVPPRTEARPSDHPALHDTVHPATTPPAEQANPQTLQSAPIAPPVVQLPKPDPLPLEFTVDPQNHWTYATNGPTQADLAFKKDENGDGYLRLSVDKYQRGADGRYWAQVSTIDTSLVTRSYRVIKFRARGDGLPKLGLDLVWLDDEKWHPEPVVLTKDWLTYELRLDQGLHIKRGPDRSWMTIAPSIPDRISTVVFFAGDQTNDVTAHGYFEIADVRFE